MNELIVGKRYNYDLETDTVEEIEQVTLGADGTALTPQMFHSATQGMRSFYIVQRCEKGVVEFELVDTEKEED